MNKALLNSKYFIAFLLTTLICGVLLTLELSFSNEVETLDYSAFTSFDAKDTLNSLTEDEKEEYQYYVDNGLSIYIDEELIALNNPKQTNGINVQDMLVMYVNDIYGIELTILDGSVDAENAVIHLTADNNKLDNYTYSIDSSESSTISAYSQSDIPKNLFERVENGEEFDVIATQEIWEYLNNKLDNTSSLTLIETADYEDDLYEFLRDDNYSDALVFASSSYIYFNHRYNYNVLFSDVNYYSVNLENQYTYIGINGDNGYSLYNKLFNTSWMLGLKSFIDQSVLPTIIEYMIDNGSLDASELRRYLGDLDTLYIGVYETYYPYIFEVNGEFQGYYVELFKHFADALSLYDVNVEFVSYRDYNYDYNDNFIYAHFYQKANLEGFLLSTYYNVNAYQIISRTDSNTYNTLSQIEGKIAIPDYLEDFMYMFDIFDEKNITKCTYPETCMSLLNSGAVDYAVITDYNREYFSMIRDTRYYVSYSLSNLDYNGYYAINLEDENAEYLMKVLDYLYPTVNHEKLFNDTLLNFEYYLIDYNEINDFQSSTIFIIITYVVIVLIIVLSMTLEYRNEKNSASKKIETLIGITNTGVLSIQVKREMFDYYIQNNSKNVLEIQMNKNMIDTLEISNYHFNPDKDVYVVTEKEFAETINAYSFADGQLTKIEDSNLSIVSRIYALRNAREITLEHLTRVTNQPIYYKYTISTSDKKGMFIINGMALDHTNINNQNIYLRELAYTDSLTGLRNNTKLYSDYLNEEYKHYITININNFKFFNESYSSEFADRILVKFAKKLEELLSEKSTAYRIVADNFLIMSKNDDITELEHLVNRVHSDCVSLYFEPEDEHINIEVYSTISSFNKDNYLDFTQFSKEMTIKNYLGKKNTGYYIEPKEQEDLSFQQLLQAEVFKLKDFKNFEIFLQPKVDPFTSKCIGAEALIRWNHPVHGMIAPFHFISKFELLGKIDQLDAFVLEQTCKTIKELQNDNIVDDDFSISFNLSKYSVMERDFVKEIKDILSNHDVDYKNIGVEILESIDVKRNKHLVDKFNELHNLGMNISIDDYGSGYANVYTVTLLPFTKLKFDKSLLDDIDTDAEKRTLFKNLVKMNTALGHKILVEGVENKKQIEIIKKQGVKIVQGYFYSKPLPIKDFKDYLKSDNK